MRFARLAALLVPAAALVVLAAAPTVRKDPHGVYAIIDSAIVEPSADRPERIQLWGRFALADIVTIKDGKIETLQLGFFHRPKPGFMYYTVNRRDTTATYADWAKLRAAAGTGRLIGWGSHIPAMDSAAGKVDTIFARIVQTYNGRIRMPGEPLASPDTFPQRMPGAEKMMVNRFRGPVELGFTTPDTAGTGRVIRPPEL